MLSSIFSSLAAKIAAVAIAAAAAAGGLAATGSLPAPAQQVASQAAATVGIHVPSPHAPEVTETTDVTKDETPTATVTGTVTATATPAPNHGGCVSYAAHAAASMGLTGSMKGQFIAGVAQDPTAISAKVSANGVPDAACQTAIANAAKAATSPGNSGDHGVTGTVTGTANSPTGFGQGSHPSATDHPSATNHPGKP